MDRREKEDLIKCIFLSEFDINVGPQMIDQYSEIFPLNNQVFTALADYIIPKPELCGKIITVYKPYYFQISMSLRMVLGLFHL